MAGEGHVFSTAACAAPGSNGNDIKTKANKIFENGVFFYIDAKRTLLIVSKLFSKRSEHMR